jgi:hypothetical protein
MIKLLKNYGGVAVLIWWCFALLSWWSNVFQYRRDLVKLWLFSIDSLDESGEVE